MRIIEKVKSGYCFCGEKLKAGSYSQIPVELCVLCGYTKTDAGYDDATLSRLYGGEHPAAYQGCDGTRFGSLVGGLRARLATVQLTRTSISRLQKGTVVLDFGCGQGYYLDTLRASGYKPIGVEINDAAAFVARAKGHDVRLHFEELAGTVCGGAVSIHVLEHIPDVSMALDQIRTALKPGSPFCFEVPNFTSWQARLFRFRWLHAEPNLHIHHFSPKAFLSLLESHGFQPEKASTFSLQHGLLGWIQSIYNLVFPYNRFFYLVVLNNSLSARLRAWKEIVLFPIVALVATLLLCAEAVADRGAVIRVEGLMR